MTEIIMPKMGDAMTEGKVVRWYKKAGEAVKKGEPLLEIETDKVNLDLEAEADGTLGNLEAQEGQMVPVGGVLAQILGGGVAPPIPAARENTAEGGGAPQKTEETQRRVTDKKDSVKKTTGEYGEAIEMKAPRTDRSKVVPMPKAPEGRQRSSPLARKMAREMGVSLEAIQGSGPQGRIIAADVKNAGGGQAPSPVRTGEAPGLRHLETKQIPLSAMRRTIAKRLAESTGPIPHFYLTVDYDVTNLLSVRQQMMDIEEAKLSVNDFVIRAAALALRHHPNVNASWGDEAITQHGEVHIGVAVATPEGLITPVIRNADQKSVPDIAQEVRALAEKAKNRKLLPNEYQGSTFTISNLGAWGIEEFTAIINPPNSAILAIGAAEARPVVIDGQVVVRSRMKVTMSCDHRVVDGAAGAEYLKTLRQLIEQPLRLVI
ncbi:MAG TPA: dihydrolipoamide acetyltransferase family protein [Thermoanaerobaculia bacterium]|jgi:pyruvate dehydrogenase E2 component (dihydrolipoamide acetyltransferase)|nr:dihydrolipoamide acetyltransferase family protein [Thermoanaerobaculia bacterium]